jgi:hypothetical protein
MLSVIQERRSKIPEEGKPIPHHIWFLIGLCWAHQPNKRLSIELVAEVLQQQVVSRWGHNFYPWICGVSNCRHSFPTYVAFLRHIDTHDDILARSPQSRSPLLREVHIHSSPSVRQSESTEHSELARFTCGVPSCRLCFPTQEALLRNGRIQTWVPNHRSQPMQVSNFYGFKCRVPGCGLSFPTHNALFQHNFTHNLHHDQFDGYV